MTAHLRTQIRAAAAAALAGLPTTGARVFQSRTVPTADADLPALLVYTRTERSGFDAMGTDTERPLRRELSLWIVAVCRATDAEPDDTLEQMCVEATAALAVNPGLAALVLQAELVSTEFDVSGERADRRPGRAGMTWRGLYRTPAGDPTSPA